MTRRTWTETEIEVVRQHYVTRGGIWCAQQLNRGVSSIYRQASRLGLMTTHQGLTEERRKTITRLNQLGYSDADIAQEMKLCRRQVSLYRHRLGLPSNTHNERHRRKTAAALRQQLQRCGLTSSGQLRVAAFQRYATESGWPADLRPRAVQMLNAMWERGPMTREELALAIGMPWKGARKSLVSNDPEGTYLQSLINRGLVMSLGRVVRGSGRGRSCSMYCIPPHIERGPVRVTRVPCMRRSTNLTPQKGRSR